MNLYDLHYTPEQLFLYDELKGGYSIPMHTIETLLNKESYSSDAFSTGDPMYDAIESCLKIKPKSREYIEQLLLDTLDPDLVVAYSRTFRKYNYWDEALDMLRVNEPWEYTRMLKFWKLNISEEEKYMAFIDGLGKGLYDDGDLENDSHSELYETIERFLDEEPKRHKEIEDTVLAINDVELTLFYARNFKPNGWPHALEILKNSNDDTYYELLDMYGLTSSEDN